MNTKSTILDKNNYFSSKGIICQPALLKNTHNEVAWPAMSFTFYNGGNYIFVYYSFKINLT